MGKDTVFHIWLHFEVLGVRIFNIQISLWEVQFSPSHAHILKFSAKKMKTCINTGKEAEMGESVYEGREKG